MKLPTIFRKENAAAERGPWQPGALPALPVKDRVPAVRSPDKTAADDPWLPDAVPAARKRLVFAFDATASRSDAWDAAKGLTDTLLGTLPGQLDVALAVHGGEKLHTFTGFTANAGKLRDKAAGVQCRAGFTKLLDILRRVDSLGNVDVVLYIGDAFEESEAKAAKLADRLGQGGTRVVILQDGDDDDARGVFAGIAERTGGALLPFNISSLKRVRELTEAVAVLAVGGTELLETKQATMPAATLLLEHLDTKRIGARR